MQGATRLAIGVPSTLFAVLALWASPSGPSPGCEVGAPARTAQDWTARADCRRDQGDPEHALADYEQALRLAPEGSRALYYGLGRTYEDLGRIGEALDAFGKAAKAAKPDADLLYHLGLSHEQLGSYDMALNYFRKAITLDPRDNRAQRNIGFVLTRQRHNELAIPFFKEAIRIDPRDHKAWLNLGVTYSRIEDDIREELKQLSFGSPSGRVDPNEPMQRRSDELRAKLSGFDWFGEAVAAIREAARVAPDEPVYWYNLGTTLSERRDRWPEAVDALAKAVALKPDYYEALRNLTLYQTRLGRYGEAHDTALRLAQVAGPDDMWLEVQLADLELQLGQWDSAERRYRHALDVDPDDVDAHMGLAIAYRRQARRADSDQHLRRATELRPDLKGLFERAVEQGP